MIPQTSTALFNYVTEQEKRAEHERAHGVFVGARLTPGRRVKAETLEPFKLPEVPGLVPGARRIDEADEQDLRWYFGNPTVASVTRSSGAFGNQLEIASAYGYGSLPCRRCGGKWRSRKRNGNAEIVDCRDGTGRCPKDHFGKRITYASALKAYRDEMRRKRSIVLMAKPVTKPGAEFDGDTLWTASVAAFKAQGKTLLTDAQFRAAYPDLPEERTQPCRVCQGIGVIPRRAAAHVEITVYPTGSSKHGATARRKDPGKAVAEMNSAGVVQDGFGIVAMGELARYREVHDLLADVAKLSPIAAVSLEEYYSERNGQVALERMVSELCGLQGAAAVRAASQLRDHQCGVYLHAAFGAGS